MYTEQLDFSAIIQFIKISTKIKQKHIIEVISPPWVDSAEESSSYLLQP